MVVLRIFRESSEKGLKYDSDRSFANSTVGTGSKPESGRNTFQSRSGVAQPRCSETRMPVVAATNTMTR
jgi:hypothetical protein